MNWLQFFASVIGSMAWPIAVVVLGIMFREQVKTLLGKVKSLKAAGLEAAFAEDTKRVAEEVQAKLLTPTEMNPLDSPMGKKFVPRSDERPSAIILDSWLELEHAVGNMINELAIETKRPANIKNCLEALKDYVTTDTRIFIDELRRLRNQVAHNRDLEPDQGTAYRYYISTKNVIDSLRRRTNELLHRELQHARGKE